MFCCVQFVSSVTRLVTEKHLIYMSLTYFLSRNPRKDNVASDQGLNCLQIV